MFIAWPKNRFLALPAVADAASKGFARAIRWCADCQARAEQRRALAALDARLLKDIGIAPPDAARECGKPFWRA